MTVDNPVNDDYTRECLWIEADTSLSGPCVVRVLDYVTELRGRPRNLITDNGPEFAGLALERTAQPLRKQPRYRLSHLLPAESSRARRAAVERLGPGGRRARIDR